MTIQGIGGPGSPQRPDDPGSARGTRKPAQAGSDRGDQIELSANARRVAALSDAALRLPEVRLEKVEALREAVASGTYEVDPRALARAILEFEDGLPR